MTTRDMTTKLDPDKYAKGTGALRSRRPIYMDYLPHRSGGNAAQCGRQCGVPAQ